MFLNISFRFVHHAFLKYKQLYFVQIKRAVTVCLHMRLMTHFFFQYIVRKLIFNKYLLLKK